MPVLKDAPLAVMFWAGQDPVQTLETLVAMGVRNGQLGIPGDYPLAGAAASWKSACAALDFSIYMVFAAYDGESYADVDAVRDTVGFVPPATRATRVARTLEVIQFARELGVPAVATHIGFVQPEDKDMVETVRLICDRGAEFEQKFALETGQESAAELLAFIRNVDRPSLGINFDPANMILYGTGEPVEALRMLQPKVLSVHCKDGKWPVATGQLGIEAPLGKGDVNWIGFLAQLERGGYRGPLSVEREAEHPEQRLNDIRHGLQFLRELQLFDC